MIVKVKDYYPKTKNLKGYPMVPIAMTSDTMFKRYMVMTFLSCS